MNATTSAPVTPGHCAYCCAEFRPTGIVSGYASTPAGERICYPCADLEQAAKLANPATTGASVYVSEDGSKVTSWTGGELGVITWHKNGRRDYRRYISPYTVSYNVRTPDGRIWCGRGAGAGMLLNLRVMKGR